MGKRFPDGKASLSNIRWQVLKQRIGNNYMLQKKKSKLKIERTANSKKKEGHIDETI